MVTGWLAKVEGKWYWLEADVKGEEGEVLARAEAVFVTLRAGL